MTTNSFSLPRTSSSMNLLAGNIVNLERNELPSRPGSPTPYSRQSGADHVDDDLEEETIEPVQDATPKKREEAPQFTKHNPKVLYGRSADPSFLTVSEWNSRLASVYYSVGRPIIFRADEDGPTTATSSPAKFLKIEVKDLDSYLSASRQPKKLLSHWQLVRPIPVYQDLDVEENNVVGDLHQEIALAAGLPASWARPLTNWADEGEEDDVVEEKQQQRQQKLEGEGESREVEDDSVQLAAAHTEQYDDIEDTSAESASNFDENTDFPKPASPTQHVYLDRGDVDIHVNVEDTPQSSSDDGELNVTSTRAAWPADAVMISLPIRCKTVQKPDHIDQAELESTNAEHIGQSTAELRAGDAHKLPKCSILNVEIDKAFDVTKAASLVEVQEELSDVSLEEDSLIAMDFSSVFEEDVGDMPESSKSSNEMVDDFFDDLYPEEDADKVGEAPSSSAPRLEKGRDNVVLAGLSDATQEDNNSDADAFLTDSLLEYGFPGLLKMVKDPGVIAGVELVPIVEELKQTMKAVSAPTDSETPGNQIASTMNRVESKPNQNDQDGDCSGTNQACEATNKAAAYLESNISEAIVRDPHDATEQCSESTPAAAAQDTKWENWLANIRTQGSYLRATRYSDRERVVQRLRKKRDAKLLSDAKQSKFFGLEALSTANNASVQMHYEVLETAEPLVPSVEVLLSRLNVTEESETHNALPENKRSGKSKKFFKKLVKKSKIVQMVGTLSCFA